MRKKMRFPTGTAFFYFIFLQFHFNILPTELIIELQIIRFELQSVWRVSVNAGVEWVTQDRIAEMRQMDSYLMSSPCFERNVKI